MCDSLPGSSVAAARGDVRDPRPRGRGASVLAIALTVGGACRSALPVEPGPLPAPDLDVTLALEPGSALSGPGAGLDEVDGARSSLALRLLYVEGSVPAGLAPLAPETRLVADLMGARPLLSGPDLTAGSGYARGEEARSRYDALLAGEAGRVVELLDERRVVPSGATLTAAAVALETVEDPLDWLDEYADRGPIPRRVALSVTAGDPPEVALAVDDLDPLVEAERIARAREATIVRAEPPGPPEEEQLRRETLVLEVSPAPDQPLLVAWPSPFATGSGRSFVALLVVSEEQPEEAELEAAHERLAAAAAEHARRTAPLEGDGYERLRLREAVRAFRGRGGRPALLLLADEAGAPLTADLVLFADEELLAALSAEAFGDGEGDGEEATALDDATLAAGEAGFGWRLDRAAWRLLCQRLLAEQLDEEGQAALLRHAGALGRFPDVLLDALAASADAEAFSRRLEAEQGYFLDDADPSARLRAHEWLAARGRAVPGYAPFAPRDERRAALRAAEEAPPLPTVGAEVDDRTGDALEALRAIEAEGVRR